MKKKPHSKSKKKKKAKTKWKWRIFGISLMFILLAAASIAAYTFYLSSEIKDRFASRRWSLPSTVYSDATLLYPGERINQKLLLQKLKNLEYREVDHLPKAKGEVQVREQYIEIFSNDLKIPQRQREGFAAKIQHDNNSIIKIIRRDTQESLSLLELEPQAIMLFFGPQREKRQLVSINEIPEHLKHAVLAAEDSRFYEHHGIDPKSLLRAIWVDLSSASIRQGGSTLTQQLAKNYFLTPDRTWTRKFNEVLIAFLLESHFNKDEILEIYLNEIYFGQKGSVSVDGVGEAASFYFSKPAKDLSIPESATLAGLIKAPNKYSPYVNEKRCRLRRNQVMESMKNKGWISQADLEKYESKPVETSGYRAVGKTAPYFVDYVADQLTALYSKSDLASLGLSIYTTLDTQVQMAAEESLEQGLLRLEKAYPKLQRKSPASKLQGAVLVIQPKTGHILAMAGGRDYSDSQFNRIVQAKRQPGSLMKPFVALAALDKFTPATRLSNAPKTYEINGKKWEPENYSETSEIDVSLRRAVQQSYNLAIVDLAMKTGLNHILKCLTPFEFSTPLQPYPSLALGAFEMIPLEIAQAYCVFAADGALPYPLSIKKVADESGTLLEQRHTTINQATSPEKAFLVTDILRSVVEGGTAKSLRDKGIYFPVAAKTGTTNDFRDAWFVGYTPDILALIWVGFDNGDPINLAGAGAALPIWADLMKAIPQYVSENWFKPPAGVVQKEICAESGMLADSGCPQPVAEYFLAETAPQETCKIHEGHTPIGTLLKKVFDYGK